MKDEAETKRAEGEAAALILTLRTWPTVGDELHARLVALFAEGANTARARTFCARLQQELSRTGQENGRARAAEKTKLTWTIPANRHES